MRDHRKITLVVAAVLVVIGLVIADVAGVDPSESLPAKVVARNYQPSRTDFGHGTDSDGRAVTTTTHVPEKFTVYVAADRWSGPVPAAAPVYAALKEVIPQPTH